MDFASTIEPNNLSKLNPAQREIVISDCHLVVTANAGSGKTHTMVQKIVHLIENGIPIEQIAAITFTDKAANEISERVFNSIQESNLTNEQKEEFRDKFHNATFSTIHSFCNQLLKEFPIEAGLNPNFNIISTLELNNSITQAIHKFLKDKLDTNDNNLNDFIQKYGLEKFKEIMTSLYYKRTKIKSFNLDFNQLHNGFISNYEQILRSLKSDVIQLVANYQINSDKYKKADSSKIEALIELLNIATNPVEIIAAIKETIKGGSNIAKYVKAGISELDSDIDVLSLLAMSDFTDAFEDITNFSNELNLVYKWAIEISQNVELITLNNNLISHDDSLILTARMLTNHSDILLPKLQNRFHTIMVDEFQDTDELQYSIIKSFISDLTKSNNDSNSKSTNLVLIGDTKQSIYAFRGAEVGVFIAAKLDLMKLNTGDVTKSKEVTLAETYRLFPKLIEFNNVFFNSLFGISANRYFINNNLVPKIEYNKFISGLERDLFLPYSSVNVINFASKNEDNKKIKISELVNQEATAIANLITNILNGEIKLFDKETNNERLAQPKDIVVLSQTGTNFGVLKKCLDERNVPVIYKGEKNWFENQVILDLAKYLKFLLFPEDDIALATILKSPFFGIGDSELLSMKLRYINEIENKNIRLFALVKIYLQDVYSILINQINIAQRINITFLISNIIKKSKWNEIVSTNDLQRQNSLTAIFNYARGYEEKGFGNLYDFVLMLEELSKNKITEEINYSADSNSVEIQTIHKSKGLEFPIVILYNTYKSGGTHYDNSQGVLYDYFDTNEDNQNNINKNNFIAKYVKEYKAQIEYEEMKRLIYVAMTRTEQHIFISCLNNYNADTNKYKTFNDYITNVFANNSLPYINNISLENELLNYKNNYITKSNEETIEKEQLIGELKDFEKNIFFSASKIKKFKDERSEYNNTYIFGKPSEKSIIEPTQKSDTEKEGVEPIAISNQEKSIIIGNVFHFVMQHFNKWYSNDNLQLLKTSLDNFISVNHIINDDDIKQIVLTNVINVINTDLIKSNISQITNGKKEHTLFMPIGDDFFTVSIDLFLKNEIGHYEIWDWKTNQVNNYADFNQLALRYEYQMKTYAYFAMLLNDQQEIFSAKLIFTNACDTKKFSKCYFEFNFTRSELIDFYDEMISNINEIKEYENNIYDNYDLD